MSKVDIGDCEIYYERHGAGPTLLLLPGLGGTGDYWAPQIDAFAARYEVIIHDHRGTGQSSRSLITYSVEQMASDLLALMDVLEISRAHMVGHSTGGAMAQIIAAEQPERLKSAVYYASWTKADAQFRLCFYMRKSILESQGPSGFAHTTPLFLFPPWYNRDHGEAMDAGEAALTSRLPPAEIIASRINAILAFDQTNHLSRMSVPSLVVCAKDDILTPPYFSEQLAAGMPNARLEILEDGGHACSITRPERFNQVVLNFLDEQEELAKG